MLKTHKKQLIISSVIILLPILIGLLLWNKLPGQFATHWGADGQADGWSSKAFAVFFPPFFLLAVQWLCVLITAADKGNKEQSKKVTGIVLWIIPSLSLFLEAITYGIALGAEWNMTSITFVMLGLMFIGIGNYLPKCKQNHTIGIKVPWALGSEENWNATHRFGGKVWVIGGILLLLAACFPTGWTITAAVVILLVLALIPMLYSYHYYTKQQKEGTTKIYIPPMSKSSLLIIAALLLFLFCVLFTGNIEYQYGETSFFIEADRWNDLTVDYDAIDSIEYRDEMVSGSRDFGFGSPRLLIGMFSNEEFGTFTRYTYGGCDSCIVLDVEGKILVISGRNAEETKAIYEKLSAFVA